MSPDDSVEKENLFSLQFNDISRISCTFVLSLSVKGHFFPLVQTFRLCAVTVGIVGLYTEFMRWFSNVG